MKRPIDDLDRRKAELKEKADERLDKMIEEKIIEEKIKVTIEKDSKAHDALKKLVKSKSDFKKAVEDGILNNLPDQFSRVVDKPENKS